MALSIRSESDHEQLHDEHVVTVMLFCAPQVVGRHLVALLCGCFYIMMQIIMSYHVLGVYEVEISETGETRIMSGHPAPDFDSREWKDTYVYHVNGDMKTPMSADTVNELITRVFKEADVDAP